MEMIVVPRYFLYVLTIFFPSKNFYKYKKKTFKSNNKNNNYINQLLKLPLLKHTHTHTQKKKEKNNNNKKGNTNLPAQGMSIPTLPQAEAPTVTVKE